MKICGYFFLFGSGGGGGHYEIRLVILFYFIYFFFGGGGSFLYILGLFKVESQNGNIFWAAEFQIFLGMPDIPDFLFYFFLGGGERGG